MTGPPQNSRPAPAEIGALTIDPVRPILVLDVDEVLAMFMRGFERFVGRHGLEMRITRFALFQSIFRPGEAEHLYVAAGRALFETFFETDVEAIEVAPGAREAIAALAGRATVVILTNAPPASRQARTRWLARSGFPYPLIVNTGVKGPAVAALAERTRGPAAFVDDLLPNLDSVADAAPRVHRFQMVADERLRELAFTAPERHRRIDEWPQMREALAEALGTGTRVIQAAEPAPAGDGTTGAGRGR
ncbi:MAG: HAD family hydrolase [Caulobacteraceae bacterium]